MDGLSEKSILPEQAWFWSKRWQKLEQQAQADLEEGRVVVFYNLPQALDALDRIGSVKGLRLDQAGDFIAEKRNK